METPIDRPLVSLRVVPGLDSVRKSKELTALHCHTSTYDMAITITTREFIRNFSRLKKSAANGDEIIVRDRRGNDFIFRARTEGPSLGEQLKDICGTMRTGKPIKSLAGFGRNRR